MASEREVRVALEGARRELLDVSARNRLLQIPATARARLVRVVDERSDVTYVRLVADRKAYSFAPAAEAVATEEAFDASGDGVGAEVGMEQPEEEEGRARHQDLILQTPLSSAQLQARLLSLHLEARTHIEDQGVNILYLALGQLRWFEDERSEEARHAPLLLVPVGLERASAGAKFKLRRLEEEPSANLTLQTRLAEFGLRLPIPEIDDEFCPATYFAEVADIVKSMDRWAVLPDAMVLGFFSFSTFLMYRDLDSANWPEGEGLCQHPLIRSLLVDGFRGSPDVVDDRTDLDEMIAVERLNHVVDADSSQSLAVEAVRMGSDLIIQGPPGTGKSQTITNLIATAVFDGKTVLFVAEKMAALEVVQRRLKEIGLGAVALELHSHKTNKRTFLEELGRTLNEPVPSYSDPVGLLERLASTREQLNRHARLLNTPIAPSGVSPYGAIGHLSLLTVQFPGTVAPLLAGAEGWAPAEREAHAGLLRQIGERLKQMGAPREHPWRAVRCAPLTRFEAEALRTAVVHLNEAFCEAAAAAKLLSTRIGLKPGATPAEWKEARRLAGMAVVAPLPETVDLTSSIWDDRVFEVAALVDALIRRQTLRARYESRFAEEAWDRQLGPLRPTVAAYGTRWFRFLITDYRRAMALLKGLHRDSGMFPQTHAERIRVLDDALELQALEARLVEGEALGKEAFGALWKGGGTDPAAVHPWLKWLLGIESAASREALRAILGRGMAREDLAATLQIAKETWEAFASGWEEMKGQLDLDETILFKDGSLESAAVDIIREILGKWKAHPEQLADWIAYWHLEQQAREAHLDAIVDCLISEDWPADAAESLFWYSYYRTVYEYFTRRFPDLRVFDGLTHEQIVREFRDKDKQRIELARLEVLAAHAGRRPAPHHAQGALGIVLGEINKKRRHMAIRKLIGCAAEAVQAIKPVFMMSPLSVAQFLEPGRVRFDLVVFDEASQVKPVDALGAVARAGQLVVVGDGRQLPPTNFFMRIDGESLSGEDVDPLAAAGDMESVLSLAAARGMHSKMLRWHYRSRHGTLIAVSNHEFYENALFVVPSPVAQHETYGLKFCHVVAGVYRRGGKRQDNPVEARCVAEAVLAHARKHPEHSLGVAAFSVSQRDAILDALESLRREHPELEPFFSTAHPHEPFFVKNLENVQGDERDVILISVGYGRDASGYLAMNFGPLNREGGERRLNVLITRAKLRCVVFSSIQHADIDLNRSQAGGVRALKTFLKYAETGILGTADPHTGREPDSPFERAVMEALQKEGHVVHPQVGVAGFFIDLAVVDPEAPGRYLLGIECDGAAYHSSRSARERDRQRQAVLEDHGWVLHRIWSTDWFMAPERELKKVLKAIMRAPQGRPTASSQASAQALAVEWKPVAAAGAATLILPAYEECMPDVPPMSPVDVPMEDLANRVYRVVEIEGPVHVEEVVSRMRDAWQLGRAGPRFQEAIHMAVHSLNGKGWIIRDGDFLSLPHREVRARNRGSVTSASLRKVERIDPREWADALVRAVETYHGLQKAEAPTTVARLLGIARTTQEVESAVCQAVTSLLESGILVEMDSFIKPAKSQGTQI